MTTAQHSSYLNANLPNLKAQSSELLGGEGGSGAKDEREQIVPTAEKEASSPIRPAVPGSPATGGGATEGAPSESPTGGAAGGGDPMEKKLLSIDEISTDVNNDVLVKVPADLVGRMIGKHGTVIKELQLQSGAFINMAKEGEVYRLARITGGQIEARLCACLLVEKFTPADNAEKRAKLAELIAHYRLVGNRPQRQFLVESFTLPAEMVGRIIGRGGQLLRELQDKTHAKIDLPRSMGGDEVRKVITISGMTSEVTACRELLRSLVHEYSTMHTADEAYYAPSSYDPAHVVPSRMPYYPPPYAPYSGYMPPTHAAPPPPPAGYADSYGQQYMMRGYYYPEQAAPDLSRLSLEADDHVVPMPVPRDPYAQPHAAPLAAMPPLAESIISIPGEMVGRLIGRQGVAVKQLQSETHTRIDILDPAPNTSNAIRYVRVTGPKLENVQHCIQLIQTRVAAFWGNAPPSPASTHSMH